jgi:hypothetical protein
MFEMPPCHSSQTVHARPWLYTGEIRQLADDFVLFLHRVTGCLTHVIQMSPLHEPNAVLKSCRSWDWLEIQSGSQDPAWLFVQYASALHLNVSTGIVDAYDPSCQSDAI